MKIFGFLLFVVAAIIYSTEGRSIDVLSTEGINNGYKATWAQFKYQVAVHMDGDYRCGGGILSEYFVISVAQCIIDEETGEINQELFTVNAISLTETADLLPISILIEQVYVPTDYKPVNPVPEEPYRTEGDLAVLKLEDALDLGPISLLSKLNLPDPQIPYLADALVIAGFGYHAIYDVVHPDIKKPMKVRYCDGKLRWAVTEAVPNSVCSDAYTNPIHPSNICARVVQREGGLTPMGVCRGDSGSPLVHRGSTIVGVLIAGPKSCVEDKLPAVYTDVVHYLDFITNVMMGKLSSDIRTYTWTLVNELDQRYEFVES